LKFEFESHPTWRKVSESLVTNWESFFIPCWAFFWGISPERNDTFFFLSNSHLSFEEFSYFPKAWIPSAFPGGLGPHFYFFSTSSRLYTDLSLERVFHQFAPYFLTLSSLDWNQSNWCSWAHSTFYLTLDLDFPFKILQSFTLPKKWKQLWNKNQVLRFDFAICSAIQMKDNYSILFTEVIDTRYSTWSTLGFLWF
jgi:hypothetical protein